MASSARIVSLPETVSEYSEKRVLRRTIKKRVVSMPVKSDQTITTNVDSSLESEASVENILPDNERPSRVRVCSNLTDTPRTPTPPSSPDSIVIIGSESQISERFVRGSAYTQESPCSSSENSDDGQAKRAFFMYDTSNSCLLDWINWAGSPPKPIPALHGPSSLPYARCPS